MNLTNYQAEFKKLLKQKHLSSKKKPIRKKAFSKLEAKGFPTQKWESWRFTNLSALTENQFFLSEIKNVPQIDLDNSEYKIEGVYTIVIYNGHFQKDISSLPDGIKLLTSEQYNENNNNKIFDYEKSPFDLLNTAFSDCEVYLISDKNTIVESPIRVLFISNGNIPLMVNPRLCIDVKSGSSLTFIEEYVGDAGSLFQNEVVHISVENNAQLEHIRIQSNSKNTHNIFNLQVKQHENSRYQFYQYMDGSNLSRSNIYVDLDGKNSDCDLNCLSLSRYNQHLDNSIHINHNSHHTYSSQAAKSVLFDKSSGVFNGKIVVQKDAQKITAHQSNKNLLLSKTAKMNSNPQLEIYADDVKCSHGSTTGQLDDDALFYFRSRGIPKKDAFILLVSGFVSEVMKKIKYKPVNIYIDKKINSWIAN